jgi:hypothetical protein
MRSHTIFRLNSETRQAPTHDTTRTEEKQVVREALSLGTMPRNVLPLLMHPGVFELNLSKVPDVNDAYLKKLIELPPAATKQVESWEDLGDDEQPSSQVFPDIFKLNLSNCTQLKMSLLSNTIEALALLRHLELRNLNHTEATLRLSLASLEHLDISNSTITVQLQCPSLKSLCASRCPDPTLLSIEGCIEGISTIDLLNISGCTYASLTFFRF